MSRVGVIGLGRIGAGVAHSLQRTGHDVTVFDLLPAATARHPHATVVSSPAEVAARSDVVIVAVVDDEQVRAVVTGVQGILRTARPGNVVIIVSTVSVVTIHEIAQAARAGGVDLLDVGVTGGGRPAEEGKLVAMIGGDERVVEKVRPVLDGFTQLAVTVGAQGAGMKAKLARNLVVYATWMVNYQAQMLAEAAGVDLDKLRQVIETSDREIGGLPPWLRRRDLGAVDYPPEVAEHRAATAGLAHKDLHAAMELARSLGVDLPAAPLAERFVESSLGLRSAPAPTGPPDEDRRRRGMAKMAEVYNFGSTYPEPTNPYTTVTVDHLFADIWTRPGLSTRDRRLVILGVIATQGDERLLEIQLGSAMDNGELTAEEVQEIVVQLAHYAGWPRATVVNRAAQAVIAERAE